MSAGWKNLERKVAEVLVGHRNLRGADFSKSMSDVEHPIFSIECKYRKKVPKIYYNVFDVYKRPNLAITHNERVILSLDYFSEIFKTGYKASNWKIVSSKKYNKFLEDAYIQAKGYSDTKIPIVILKRANSVGEIVYLSKVDFDKVNVLTTN